MAQTHIVHYVDSVNSVISPVDGDYYATPDGNIYQYGNGAGYSGGQMGGFFSFFKKIGNALGKAFTFQNPFPQRRADSDFSGLID